MLRDSLSRLYTPACPAFPPSSGQDTNLTDECTGYSSCDDTCKQYYDCGGSVQIQYPFWSKGPKSYHKCFCGYREFEFTCQNTTFTYRSRSGATYIIESTNNFLDFRETTVHMVDTRFLNTTCPKPPRNTTFDDDFHNYSDLFYPSSVVKLVFFFNCPANLTLSIPAQNRAGCLQDIMGQTYVFAEDDPALWKLRGDLSSLCRGGTVLSPVLKSAVAGRDLGSTFGAALGSGFELFLKWRPGSRDDACNRCEASGGWCLYANDTSLGWTFRCHCSDGWHPAYCQRGSQVSQEKLNA